MAALTVRCLTSLATPQKFWWLWVESNHQPSAYETLALSLELHSRVYWKPAEELNLVPSAQLLQVRFRRPMPGTRASFGGDGEIRTHTLLFTRQLLCQLELHRHASSWSGREADAPLQLHGPRQSPFCRDESRPDKWWSELDSNQPFGLFRPALIHLSYPTVKKGICSFLFYC